MFLIKGNWGKIDVERPFHTLCSFLQHFPHYETSFSVFQGKLHIFAQKDEVERIRQKLIREGAASNGLYYRQYLLNFPLQKPFKIVKSYYLATSYTYLTKFCSFPALLYQFFA